MTGAPWYPNANRSKRYDDVFPGATWKSPDKAIIHSTEGWSLPPYDGGAKAPNMTLVPNFTLRRFEYYQHFPFTMSSRALRNEAGGVQTNTDRAVQFEIVGTCSRALHLRTPGTHLYMPELPAWALFDLGKMVEWFNHEHGIPLQAPGFKSYETLSPGTVSVRMNNAQWNAYTGWAGHQHVPENTHLDPGNINIAAIMAHAVGMKEDRNMPTPKEIAVAVVQQTIYNENDDAPRGITTLGGSITNIEVSQDRFQKQLLAELKSIREDIAELKGTK